LKLLDTLGELEDAKRCVEGEEKKARIGSLQQGKLSNQLNFYWPALTRDYANQLGRRFNCALAY